MQFGLNKYVAQATNKSLKRFKMNVKKMFLDCAFLIPCIVLQRYRLSWPATEDRKTSNDGKTM